MLTLGPNIIPLILITMIPMGVFITYKIFTCDVSHGSMFYWGNAIFAAMVVAIVALLSAKGWLAFFFLLPACVYYLISCIFVLRNLTQRARKGGISKEA